MASTGSSRSLVLALVATPVLMLPPSAHAQQVGVKAGVNFASLTPEEDEDPDTSRRPGPIGGLWVRTPPLRRLSFQFEGLFSEKGVTFNAPGFGGNDSLDIRLRYLEIPLLVRVDAGSAGAAARPFIIGGVAPAFKLSAHATAVADDEEVRRNIDDEIYSADAGLVGGLGVELGRLQIEGRYTHGLRHINTDDNGDEDRIKNRVVSVLVGFRFR